MEDEALQKALLELKEMQPFAQYGDYLSHSLPCLRRGFQGAWKYRP